MLAYKPKSDLLPVMPGMRVYSVDSEEYVITDEELYIEGVVVTNDSLKIVLCGDIHDLGDGYFLSRKDALDWIEKNRKPTVWEIIQKAAGAAVWHKGTPTASGNYLVRFSDGSIRNIRSEVLSDDECFLYYYGGSMVRYIKPLEWAPLSKEFSEPLAHINCVLPLEEAS